MGVLPDLYCSPKYGRRPPYSQARKQVLGPLKIQRLIYRCGQSSQQVGIIPIVPSNTACLKRADRKEGRGVYSHLQPGPRGASQVQHFGTLLLDDVMLLLDLQQLPGRRGFSLLSTAIREIADFELCLRMIRKSSAERLGQSAASAGIMTDFEDERHKIKSMASMLKLQNNHNGSLKTTGCDWQLLHCVKKQEKHSHYGFWLDNCSRRCERNLDT